MFELFFPFSFFSFGKCHAKMSFNILHKTHIECLMKMSLFKNKCGNKTAENNFGVFTENVPCGSSGTTCSKTVRIQLGVRPDKNMQ